MLKKYKYSTKAISLKFKHVINYIIIMIVNKYNIDTTFIYIYTYVYIDI